MTDIFADNVIKFKSFLQLLSTNSGEILPESQGSVAVSEKSERIRTDGEEGLAHRPPSCRPNVQHRISPSCRSSGAGYDHLHRGIPGVRRHALLVPGSVSLR